MQRIPIKYEIMGAVAIDLPSHVQTSENHTLYCNRSVVEEGRRLYITVIENGHVFKVGFVLDDLERMLAKHSSTSSMGQAKFMLEQISGRFLEDGVAFSSKDETLVLMQLKAMWSSTDWG